MTPKRQYACSLPFPKGTSKSERILCWKMVKALDGCQYDNLVVACSGGIDSTVLAHAAALHVRLHGNGQLTLVYVNHNLRPEENIKEIKHVQRLSEPLKAECHVLLAPINSGTSIQEKARKLRYESLFRFCGHNIKRATVLLTAHNANDQAETILFRTLTGRKNVRIPKATNTNWGGLLRPFLTFTRDDIAAYARVFSLGWCEDSSNSTDKYTRNKIRHQLLPWIEANINPSVVRTLVGQHEKQQTTCGKK